MLYTEMFSVEWHWSFILSFVYFNMGFITFSFMTLLVFVQLLAANGSVDLLKQHRNVKEKKKKQKGEEIKKTTA